ncbi:hypothetical protein EIP91_010526 [Steccherinum ochraceum]|uniref:Uncharacterized protein n=1 Tax=Steccherinum ochraceum TaxID=92696 RepID=A0A4R0R8E9_9APHY|nr:hypothetical protein EIP91_010526 [Steccherinum ochraceum]
MENLQTNAEILELKKRADALRKTIRDYGARNQSLRQEIDSNNRVLNIMIDHANGAWQEGDNYQKRKVQLENELAKLDA